MSHKDISFHVGNVLFPDHRCPGPTQCIRFFSIHLLNVDYLWDTFILGYSRSCHQRRVFLASIDPKTSLTFTKLLIFLLLLIHMDFGLHDLQGSQFGLLNNLAFRRSSICEAILNIFVPTSQLLSCLS